MKYLQRYLRSVSGEEQIENLPPAELDHLLCKLFIHVRKRRRIRAEYTNRRPEKCTEIFERQELTFQHSEGPCTDSFLEMNDASKPLVVDVSFERENVCPRLT